MIECAQACEDKYSLDNRTATAATCDRQLNCWCSIVSVNPTVFEAIDTLQPLRQSGNYYQHHFAMMVFAQSQEPVTSTGTYDCAFFLLCTRF